MVAQVGGPPVPWQSTTFRIVLASTLILPLGVPLLNPVLPVFSGAFAISEVTTSYLLSAYFLPVIVLSPLIGKLLNRYGRRPVLVVSLFGFGGIGIRMMLLDDFTLIIGARLLQGIAAAGLFITTVTIIADSFTGTQRNLVFGLNVAVLSIGRAVSPVLGGALGEYGWSVPFICYTVPLLVGWYVFVRFEEPPWFDAGNEVPTASGLTGLTRRNATAIYGATIAAETVTFGTILTVLPFLLAAEYGTAGVVIGTVLTVTTVSSAIVATGNGRLTHVVSTPTLIACGFVLFGASLVGIGFAPSLLLIAGWAIVFGAGIGLILLSVDAVISDLVTPGNRATALSLRNSATGIGKAGGPLVFSAVTITTGYRSTLVYAGVLSLVVGIAAILVVSGSLRCRHRPVPT